MTPSSRTPPDLARRLDRIARRAHAFHRFAHHPLCDAYAGEVVRLGRRTRICRGCALAALGAAAGGMAALALPASAVAALALGLAVASALGALAPGGRARSGKLLTRAAPAAAAGAVVASGLRRGGLAGIAVAAGAAGLVALALAAYRRRGPDRTPCVACPERASPRACSGFRPILRREAAFGRLAGRLLATPPSPPLPPSPGT